MLLEDRLRAANYRRGAGEAAPDDSGQCGLLPCDFSRMVEDQNGESFRYCDRLGIRVDDYDTCKYYSDTRMQNLIGQMSDLLHEEQVCRERAAKRTDKQKKKSHKGWIIFVIFCAAILLYWYLA